MKKGMKITAEAQEGRGYIRITDAIGTYSETGSAAVVRAAVDSFLRDGIRRVTVYATSPGGSTFEMEDIIIELERLDEVDVYLGAMAASAITRLVARFHTTADERTKLMIHKPEASIYGNSEIVKSKLGLLESIEGDYRRDYAKKMGITEAQVDLIWKQEKWYTAQEALKDKLINAVGKPPHTPQAIHDAMVTACAACDEQPAPPKPPQPEPAPNTPNEESVTNKKMDRLQMIAALGLAADATDAEILAAAKKAKIASDQLDAVTATAKAAREKRGKELVAKALLEKKITVDVVATYEAWAMEDPDKMEAVLAALPVVPKLSTETGKDGDGKEGEANDRKAWTLAEWQDKDPVGLEKLYNEKPSEFEKLANASIK